MRRTRRCSTDQGLVARVRVAVPDHSTLSRRAEALDVPQPQSSTGIGAEPVHLLVDSTGLKLCGAGEWLLGKHGIKTRQSWRKLHIGMEADTGEIVAAALTTNEVDDAYQVGPLLDQIEGSLPRSPATAPTTRIASIAP
jgi:Transposase DDE domain